MTTETANLPPVETAFEHVTAFLTSGDFLPNDRTLCVMVEGDEPDNDDPSPLTVGDLRMLAAWGRRSVVPSQPAPQDDAPINGGRNTALEVVNALDGEWDALGYRVEAANVRGAAALIRDCHPDLPATAQMLERVSRMMDLAASRAVSPAPAQPDVNSAFFVAPDSLHPATLELVSGFAAALAAKLRASEMRYGWSTNWSRDGWCDELVAELLRHVQKGDPIDVAAYCAFAWFHGWDISPAPAQQPQPADALVEAMRGIDAPDFAGVREVVDEAGTPDEVEVAIRVSAGWLRKLAAALRAARGETAQVEGRS